MPNEKNIIICGSCGMGKTSYAINKWNQHILLRCNNLISSRTYEIFENALFETKGVNYRTDDEILEVLYETIKTKQGIIVDNVEILGNKINILKLIVNIGRNLQKELIFIFDIQSKDLYKSNTFMTLLDWNVININDIPKNFQSSYKELKSFINCISPLMPESDVEKIINISEYNYNNIKRIICIKNLLTPDNNRLSEEVILEYYGQWLNERFKDLSDELIDILRKSSIIGEIFDKCILEDRQGFNISGVEAYLDDLEKKKAFITKYLPSKDFYKFLTSDIYNSIFSSISSESKNKWTKQLQKYYIHCYYNNKSELLKLRILTKIKELAFFLNEYCTIFNLNHVLLYEYIRIHDFTKAESIIDELVAYSQKEDNDIVFVDYLQSVKLRILIDQGKHKEALKLVNIFLQKQNYYGSKNYLKYYYVKCLYNCGDIDGAYKETSDLISYLKQASHAGISNQPIYPLVYSLVATIQNHLNIDDGGIRYYTLALNYAYNKLSDNEIYYDILKKCDMFYDTNECYTKLKECIEYFRSTGNKFKMASVYFNLATEMMFNGDGTHIELKSMFEFVQNTFDKIPDENLAYLKNNLAIFYVIYLDDFNYAVELLESALFVGLSDFTYMTIYLNLSMCCYKLFGSKSSKFKQYYKKFIEYELKIEQRKHRTKYENVYRNIAQLLFTINDTNNTESIISNCNNLLCSDDTSSFFSPLIINIKNKALHNMQDNTIFLKNKKFYIKMIENGIFLAEFRFWE